MKATVFLKFTAALLLLFNGTGALYGGWNLITHPDGNTIALSMHWLEHTPFQDYFIPGVILFIFNGVFSFIALAGILFKWRGGTYLIAAQGSILLGWILIQMWMIQTIYFLHIVMGFTGIGLIVIGALEAIRAK